MNARRPLHQRSDSDTNSKALPSSLSSTENSAPGGEPFPSRSSTTSTKNSKLHKSHNSVHSATTGTSKSDTVQSEASLDSLPPVPPLRIIKHPAAPFSVFRESKDTPAQVPRPAEPPQFSPESSSSAPATSTKYPVPPRSILKKPSAAALPPFSEDDYRARSSSWIGSEALHLTPNRARANAQTLRLVNDIGGHARPNRHFGPEHRSESTLGHDRLSRTSGPSVEDTSYSSTTLLQPTSPVKQLPAWARYFYGRRAQREENLSANAQRPTVRPGLEGGSSTPDSLSIIYPFSSRPEIYLSRDPETATLWSLPHLDHIPLARIENLDRQVVLFCVGFLLPICWLIAAFLPLPSWDQGQTSDVEARGHGVILSKEATEAENIRERRHENARWWRRLNRVLSIVGLAIIAAIITLAIVASRTA